MSRSLTTLSVIGIIVVAAVMIFFAVVGLGNGSGYLIGLGVFVIPTVLWMLDLMRRNNPPEVPPATERRR